MDPSERPLNFEPKAHDCLRHVGGYQNFVTERFERCLVSNVLHICTCKAILTYAAMYVFMYVCSVSVDTY